jgi:hypothetical protein
MNPPPETPPENEPGDANEVGNGPEDPPKEPLGLEFDTIFRQHPHDAEKRDS